MVERISHPSEGASMHSSRSFRRIVTTQIPFWLLALAQWARAAEPEFSVDLRRESDGSIACAALPGGSNVASNGAAHVAVKSATDIQLKTYDVTGGAVPKTGALFDDGVAI